MWAWLQGLDGGAASFVGSLTGSVFGLLALLLGALFNFRLNRRRDAALRAEEIDAVSAALYGEVLHIQREIARVGKVAVHIASDVTYRKKFDRFFLEENPISEPHLYNALAAKFGMLPPSEVLAFTRFHAQVKQLRHWMPRMGDDAERPYGYDIRHILEPVRDAITDIAPTLRAIEGRLGIAAKDAEPDISKVDWMIRHEEEHVAFLEEQNRAS